MLAVLAFVSIQAATPALDARHVALSTPHVIAEIDAGKLKGELVRLGWSPDGSEFYLQTIERDRAGYIKSAKHYVVSLSAKAVKGVDQEPTWASKYWSWKSGQASPADAAFKIAGDMQQKPVRSTAAPTGGALAKGGTADPLAGSTVSDVASAAEQTQMTTIVTLKLKSQIIGEWVNEAMMPGVNWSWAPAPLRLMVFAKREGGPLMVLDDAGRRQELSGAKSAFLPAWSDDGKRMAWLEKKDKKKFELMIADVSAQ